MNETNRDLLSDAIADRLTKAIEADNEDERSKSLEEAVDLVKVQIELSKADDAYQTHIEKLSAEKERLEKELEMKKKEQKTTWIWRGVELVAVGIAVPLVTDGLNRGFKRKFARDCMSWEHDGNMFTSTPGKSVRDFFRHK